MKHTPGPWTAKPKDGVMAVYGSHERYYVAMTDGADQDETEANAALIAAAPDLLEALQDLALSATNACEALAPAGIHQQAIVDTFLASITKAESALKKAGAQ